MLLVKAFSFQELFVFQLLVLGPTDQPILMTANTIGSKFYMLMERSNNADDF